MKENLQQTIRFVKLEAFVVSDSSLTKALDIIFKICFKLLVFIFSSSEIYNTDDDRRIKVYNEEFIRKFIFEIVFDQHHLKSRAFDCISLKHVKEICNFLICNSDINLNSSFIISLRKTFA
jgi:hypothetical protein